MAERLYFKLWHLWWTSESHEDLTEDPIAIGPVLMSFCRWDPGRDNGWAVTERGRPVTCAALARRARWVGRGASERVAAALRALEEVGTAELRSDGAWGLPKFGKWQESASAAKMRKSRSKPKSDQDVQSHGGHSDLECDQDVPPLEEAEDEELPPKPPKRGKPKRVKAKPEPKPVDPRVEIVLAAIDRERIRHTLKPLPPSERHERPILTRLEDGISVDELCLAVELHSRDRGGAGRLTATTPFTAPSGRGPGGWSWSRRLLDEHAARPQSQANGRSYDLTPEQIEARLAASSELPAWAGEGDA